MLGHIIMVYIPRTINPTSHKKIDGVLHAHTVVGPAGLEPATNGL